MVKQRTNFLFVFIKADDVSTSETWRFTCFLIALSSPFPPNPVSFRRKFVKVETSATTRKHLLRRGRTHTAARWQQHTQSQHPSCNDPFSLCTVPAIEVPNKSDRIDRVSYTCLPGPARHLHRAGTDALRSRNYPRRRVRRVRVRRSPLLRVAPTVRYRGGPSDCSATGAVRP